MADELIPISPAGAIQLPDEWNLGTPSDVSRRMEAIGKAAAAKKVRHGILSSIPMFCRDGDCPYKAFCPAQQAGMVKRGDRCVKEIGELIEASERYYAEFKVEPNDPESRVDAAQIYHLLTIEVLIRRCEMLLAQGDLVEMVEAAIDPRSGESVMQPQLHKAAEFLPKLQRQHQALLKDLNATRKDKITSSAAFGISIADYNKQLISQSQIAEARMELMRSGRFAEADDYGIIEGEVTEIIENDLPQMETDGHNN